MRFKVICTFKGDYSSGAVELKFEAVYPDVENKKIWNGPPTLDFHMTVTNRSSVDHIQIGQIYNLDLGLAA